MHSKLSHPLLPILNPVPSISCCSILPPVVGCSTSDRHGTVWGMSSLTRLTSPTFLVLFYIKPAGFSCRKLYLNGCNWDYISSVILCQRFLCSQNFTLNFEFLMYMTSFMDILPIRDPPSKKQQQQKTIIWRKDPIWVKRVPQIPNFLWNF